MILTMINLHKTALSGKEAVMATDDQIYVPGVWKCLQCAFKLHKNIVRAEDGEIFVDRKTVIEPCPNDGATLRRLTWKEDAEEGSRINRQLFEFLKEKGLLEEMAERINAAKIE